MKVNSGGRAIVGSMTRAERKIIKPTSGHLEILKVAHGAGCSWYKEISYNAAANRHLSILDWARIDGKHLLREEVTAGFAFGGHLDLLTKYSETYGIDDRIVESASEGGHLEILKWAKEMFPFGLKKGILCALKNGHLSSLQYLLDTNEIILEEYAIIAAENGHLEMFEWLCEKGCVIRSADRLSERAISNGHIAVVKRALEKGIIRPNVSICSGAASIGDLELLKWAISIGCQCTTVVASKAARANHRHIIEFVMEKMNLNIEKLDKERLCNWAAFGGHLGLLRWLREELKCECDDVVADWAVQGGGHTEVLQYLLDTGVRWTNYAPLAAAGANSLRTIRWLHDHGETFQRAPITPLLTAAARHGNLPLLKFFLSVQQDAATATLQVSDAVCDAAARSGHLHVLKYLVSERKATISQTLVLSASHTKNFELAQWAAEHVSY